VRIIFEVLRYVKSVRQAHAVTICNMYIYFSTSHSTLLEKSTTDGWRENLRITSPK